MELQQLRYVVAVARTGNFSRAATRCHVSQPSLSQQIQKLEDELGERLFERVKPTARLTSFGELFLVRAVKILEEVEAAKQDAADARDVMSGTATMGILPTIAPYFLPAILGEFAKEFPNVRLNIHEETTARLLAELLAFEVDFIIGAHPILDDRFAVQELLSEELLLALPPTHTLVSKENINVTDLENEPLIIMKDGHCLGDHVLRFCDRNEVNVRVSFRSAQLQTVSELVRAGLGISFIPEMAVPTLTPAPIFRSLAEPKPHRKIIMLWHQQRPPTRCAAELAKRITARFRNA
jgi:LysR family transcriptional regulator, hydrogen peroxide-inducible genes activator